MNFILLLIASYQDDHDNYAADPKRRRFAKEIVYVPQPMDVPNINFVETVDCQNYLYPPMVDNITVDKTVPDKLARC